MSRLALLAATLLGASVLALAACSQPAALANESDTVPLPASGSAQPGAGPAPAPAAASAPARLAGPAEAAAAVTDEFFISAAHVTEVVWLPNIDAKLFSVAGGDPAINGLLTHIAFPPETPDETWSVFRVGDFESWKVVEQGPGRVVLQVRVSRIDPSSGNPVTGDKKLIVNFTSGENPTVMVTPAP
jgi:hypothetical protein